MNKYETIFVVDSLLKPDEIESIITKYQRFISANGGQIENTEPWGKKRLSYEIKKRQYGYYVLIRFEGPATMIKQLEREYRLNESVLRFMTLCLSKQALKSLEREQKPSTQKPKPVEEADKKAPEEKKEAEPAEPETNDTDQQEPAEKEQPAEPVAETAPESDKEQAPEEKKSEE